MTLKFSLPGRGVAPIPVKLEIAGPGHYQALDVVLPIKGSWRIDVTARTTDDRPGKLRRHGRDPMTGDVFDVPGVDALFDAELNEFIAQRDALVKQRKADGDKQGATAVKALRKPSTVAWGLNRVARRNASDIAALIDAGAAVRAAQAKAVQGDAGLIRDASRAWRSQINALAGKVAKLIGDQYRDEAAASFEAASVDDTLADVLRLGRFTAALEAAGFGLGGMPDVPAREKPPEPSPSPSPVKPEPEAPPEVDHDAAAAARENLERLEQKAEQTLHRLRRAEQRLDQAREAVDEARLLHQEASAARDEAARALRTDG